MNKHTNPYAAPTIGQRIDSDRSTVDWVRVFVYGHLAVYIACALCSLDDRHRIWLPNFLRMPLSFVVFPALITWWLCPIIVVIIEIRSVGHTMLQRIAYVGLELILTCAQILSMLPLVQ